DAGPANGGPANGGRALPHDLEELDGDAVGVGDVEAAHAGGDLDDVGDDLHVTPAFDVGVLGGDVVDEEAEVHAARPVVVEFQFRPAAGDVLDELEDELAVGRHEIQVLDLGTGVVGQAVEGNAPDGADLDPGGADLGLALLGRLDVELLFLVPHGHADDVAVEGERSLDVPDGEPHVVELRLHHDTSSALSERRWAAGAHRSGSVSSVRRSNRSARARKTSCPSTRATVAPRQRWMPWPKPTWGFGVRPMSNTSGWGKRSGSRLAEAMNHRTRSRALMVLPRSSTSETAMRSMLFTGGSKRRHSSVAGPASRSASARSRSHWSGWRMKASRPLQIRLMVVS